MLFETLSSLLILYPTHFIFGYHDYLTCPETINNSRMSFIFLFFLLTTSTIPDSQCISQTFVEYEITSAWHIVNTQKCLYIIGLNETF